MTTNDRYLRPTEFIESNHRAVMQFASDRTAGATTAVARAVLLFTAVRDEIAYDPYTSGIEAEVFKASTTLATARSFCVPKAILFAAACRAVGIPSRLRFADVRNHLASERILTLMQTDVFVFHGYTELLLDGRWVKAAPTFDSAMCERFGVSPLLFDGHHDAVLHQFNRHEKAFMEYVRDRGHHPDLPLADLVRAWQEYYPQFFTGTSPFSGLGNSEEERNPTGRR